MACDESRYGHGCRAAHLHRDRDDALGAGALPP